MKDHEGKHGQAFRDLACLSLGLFLFKIVEQFYGGEEANLASVMFDVL
jgi:hypothetical protein